jgi:hypothetical protein
MRAKVCHSFYGSYNGTDGGMTGTGQRDQFASDAIFLAVEL